MEGCLIKESLSEDCGLKEKRFEPHEGGEEVFNCGEWFCYKCQDSNEKVAVVWSFRVGICLQRLICM